MIKNKTVGVIIPTRFNSGRLPGKVLMDIAGKKQIEWMIERILFSQYVDKIIFAVSAEEGDEILKWASTHNLSEKVIFVKGIHNDLMSRCQKVIEDLDIDICVFASHDCTFIDSNIIDNCLERLIIYDADYSSNCVARTFADGFDIQVCTKEIFKILEYHIPKNHPTRMWTAWNVFHWRESIFPKPKIINLETTPLFYAPELRVVLDFPEDKKVIEDVINIFPKQYSFSYENITLFLKEHPEITKINSNLLSNPLTEEGAAL